MEDPDRENSANISLVLYVRARNLSDLVSLRTKLADQLQKLVDQVTIVSDSCSDLSRLECKNEAVIKAVQGVRGFQNDAADLLKKAKDSLKTTPTGDISGEFTQLVRQFNTASILQTQVEAATSVIENVRKQLTK